MGSIKGITVEIGGNTSKLEKAIKDVNKTSSQLRTELTAIEKGLKFDPKNTELLNQKQTVLAQSIQATAEKLEILKKAEENATKQLANGEIGEEQMRALRREIEACENKLEGLTKASINAKTGLYKMAEAGQALNSSGQTIGNIGDKLTKSLTVPLTAMGTASVVVSSGFEKSMSSVQAISQATEEDFERLKEKAKQMGASTSKTASESADALGYMALAGWNTEQMLSGLEPILRASEAGTMDLATCSDLVTDSMSAMGIEVQGLGHYLDVVTQAQNNSNTGMQDLLTAYVSCGGTLKNLNVSLEESSALLGVLANRGIKGAEAGNSLNSILVNLIGASSSASTALDELGVSAWDSEGNFKGIAETLEILQTALNDCTEEQKNMFIASIGGKTQMDTLQAILSGVGEEYDELKEKMEDCEGVMETTALVMQDNLAGDVTTLKSQLEAVGITIGDLVTPQIRQLAQGLTDALKHFNNLDEGAQRLITGTALFATAIGPMTKVIGTMTSGTGELINMMSGFIGALGSGKTAMQAFTTACDANPIMLVATAISVAVTAFVAFKASAKEQSDELDKLKKKSEEYTQSLEQQREATQELTKNTQNSVSAEQDKLEALNKLLPRLDELSNKTDRTKEEEKELKSIIDQLNKAMPDLKLAIDDETGAINLSTEAIKQNIQAYKDLAAAKGAQELLENASKNKISAVKNLADSEIFENDELDFSDDEKLNKQISDKIKELEKAKNENSKYLEDYKSNKLNGWTGKKQVENTIKNQNAGIDEQLKVLEEYQKEVKQAQKDVDFYTKSVEALQASANSKLATAEEIEEQKKPKTVAKVKQSSKLDDDVKSNIKNLEYQYKAGTISEEKYLKELENIRDTYFENGSEGWNEYNAKIVSIKNKSNSASLKADNEAIKNTEKLAKEEEQTRKKAISEELSLLEYKKNEGLITESEYYNSLKKLRDNNYSYMDSDWRSITSKMATVQKSIYQTSLDEQEQLSKNYISRMEKNDLWGEDSAGLAYGRILKRYQEHLAGIDDIAWDSAKKREEYEKYVTEKIIYYQEQQEKAYLNSYNNRYNNSKDWISERNFYDDWENYGDNEIEAWKRVKEYTKQSYEEGKLSYSDYAKQIKEINRSIYSSSKSLADKLVDKIKENESRKLEAVKERVNDEKALLQDSYDEEDREEQLKKLYTQEKYYRNSLTKDGQDKYNSIVSEIKKLEREKELSAVESQGEAEIAIAEQRYNEATSSAEELAKVFIQKFNEGNSLVIAQQAEALLEAEKQSEEFAKSEEEKLNGVADTVASGVVDIFTKYTDEQREYITQQLQLLEEYRSKAEEVFKGVNSLSSKLNGGGLLTSGEGKNSGSVSYNYNHYGDYNFKDKQDLDIYNKEANYNLFSVFGR